MPYRRHRPFLGFLRRHPLTVTAVVLAVLGLAVLGLKRPGGDDDSGNGSAGAGVPDEVIFPPEDGDSPVTFTRGATTVDAAQSNDGDCAFADVEALRNEREGCMADLMTGGGALADVDGDGLTDIFVTTLGGSDHLYRNLGGGEFEEATGVGLDTEHRSNGAGFADVDNDGDQDLFVTTVGESGFLLYINDGTGSFTEEAAVRGATVGDDELRLGTSVAFGDYDDDGWIDIHTTEWRPRAYRSADADHARLLRNLGPESPGSFEDVTEAAGVVLGQRGNVHRFNQREAVGGDRVANVSFGSTFVDLDGDGRLDLAVASDFGAAELFWNNGDGTFSSGTVEAEVGIESNGMGTTFGDYNGDGLLDWFVTSIYSPGEWCGEGGAGRGGANGGNRQPRRGNRQGAQCPNKGVGNRLYLNEGDRTFADTTEDAGVISGYWGWGAVSGDLDNDRDVDLMMTNGFHYPNENGPDYPFDDTPNRLWINEGDGTFVQRAKTAGIDDDYEGRGAAVADLDADGWLDLVVFRNDGQPAIYFNDGGSNQWLRVNVEGRTSDRDALGAVVTLTAADGSTQVRQVGVNGHYLAGSEKTVHFGLGGDTSPVSVEVFWPTTGETERLDDVEPGQTVTVTEPE